MRWEIYLHPDVENWFLEVAEHDPESADLIECAIDLLAVEGPTVGRPLVDRIHGSRFQNMKELRPPSSGTTEVRILFAFDRARSAVFLVAGDKSGQWRSWYERAIPLADERFKEHQKALGGGHGNG